MNFISRDMLVQGLVFTFLIAGYTCSSAMEKERDRSRQDDVMGLVAPKLVPALALLYNNLGEEVKKAVMNVVQAKDFLEKDVATSKIKLLAAQGATERDKIEAQHCLAVMYYHGISVELAYDKARELFERVVNSELSTSELKASAFGYLGKIYDSGKGGVDRDYEKAKKYFSAARERKRDWDEPELLDELPDRIGLDESDDRQTPKEYYEKIANQANDPKMQAAAWSRLASLYFNGAGVEENDAEAKKYLALAAKQEADPLVRVLAELDLAWLYKNGKGVVHSNEESRALYAKAQKSLEEFVAQTTDTLLQARAWFHLADVYDYGRGVATDDNKAEKLYLLAAQQEIDKRIQVSAWYRLGVIYADDKYVGFKTEKAQNFPKAQKFLTLAAEQDVRRGIRARAWYHLGELNETHLKDDKKAKHYYNLAAQQDNDTSAQIRGHYYLGKLYEKGEDQDFAKAKDAYERAAFHAKVDESVAKEIQKWALLSLAQLYEHGQGVTKDVVQAQKYYEELAELEGSEFSDVREIALNNVLRLHDLKRARLVLRHGQTAYDTGDYAQAKKDFEVAAESSDKELRCEALQGLSFLYLDGDGVPKDYKKARECYEEILGQGMQGINEDIRTHAALELGLLYELGGFGIVQDLMKAKGYYELASGSSDEDRRAAAWYDLGELYFAGGPGLSQDYKAAKDFFEKAARERVENGKEKSVRSRALVYLGRMHNEGLGIAVNRNQARELFERAVALAPEDSLEAEALYYLGKCHLEQQQFSEAKSFFDLVITLDADKEILQGAWSQLATMFEEGLGVAKDPAKAKALRDMAATAAPAAPAAQNRSCTLL